MADPQAFAPVKLICGIMASQERFLLRAEDELVRMYGIFDSQSPLFPFDLTDYYEKQLGKNLKRKFLSFQKLMEPERLSAVKQETNRLEEELREEFQSPHRVVNIDPGYLSQASLIMATAKDFSHRIPLQHGIYAHLEFLFGKKEVRTLEWTYPDFKKKNIRIILSMSADNIFPNSKNSPTNN